MTTNLKLNTANWFKKQLLLLGLFILAILPLVGHAQQYPVRIIPVITPPYSLKLADYAHAPESKLQLQVLMTDLQQPQHHTGIKFFLQAGLNAQPIAQSNEFIIGQKPFLLTPGANITLTSSQIKHLFDPQNINGLNPQQYANPLPEGLYQFCFQAYDFYTKNNLSEKACASVFLNQYDPPQLNIPQNAEKIQAINPYGNGSGILFQWMPRQVAPNTKYNFILKEIWDTNQSPISAFLASPVLWKEETFAPNLYYSIDKTQLIPGRRYAWQVQAFSSNPFDNFNYPSNNQIQSANYKNNGLSEIFFFDYVENCQTPTFLMAKNKGRGRVEIHWNFLGNPAGLYKIQYRKKGANTPWMHTEAYQNSALINGLDDLTEYEYRVGAVCGNVAISNSQFENNENAYAFSPVQFFTTDSQDLQNNNFQCGVMPAVDISNKEPLRQSLVANDTFTAGDFPVTIIDAQGSNGIFTGTGFIQVPYLADTKIKVAFQNITINSDKKLINGTVETEYDPEEGNVMRDEEREKTEEINDEKTSEENDSQNKPSNDKENNTENDPENKKEKEKESDQNNNENNNSSENDNSENQENDSSNPDNSSPKNTDNKDTQEPNKNSSSKSNDNNNVNAIKYLNKKYKNGETLTLNYNRKLINIPLEFISGKEKYKAQWELFNTNKELLDSFKEISQKQEFNFTKYHNDKFKIIAKVPELKNEPKVELNVIIKEKDFKSQLSITDSDNKNRKAKAGETLYFINKPTFYDEEKKVTVDANPSIPINEIHPDKLQWKIDNITDNKLKGKEKFTLSIKEKDNKTITSISENPTTISQNVNVKWVEEDRSKTAFNLGTQNVPDKMKSIFELTQWMEKITNGINKIPFFKKIKKNEKLDNTLGFHFNIIPYETESLNKEANDNRFYYREKTYIGGFEVGIAGSIKQPIWELPVNKIPYVGTKLKEYIKAEVFVKADANMQGEIKGEIKQRKYPDEKVFKATEMNFISELTMPVEFGVGAEAKILKKNDYLHFNATASGKVNTKLLQIDELGIKFLSENVNLDFRVDVSGTFLGKKLEVAPFYERFLLIKKQQQNGK